MTWNVFYHDFNADEIRIFNVFDHNGFHKDVVAALKECETKEAFAYTIRRDLFYRFGHKCEWETLIKPWCGGKDETGIKVDVYQQIRWNWEIFIDYLWGTRDNKPSKRAVALTKQEKMVYNAL